MTTQIQTEEVLAASNRRQNLFLGFKFPKTFLGLLPILTFAGIFLAWPLSAIFRASLHDNHNHITFAVYRELFTGIYREAFITSFKLAFLSALIAGFCGAAISAALVRTSGTFRSLISSASGVLANTGGVPLAFMFIAAYGQDGLITKFLLWLHWDIYAGSFDIFNFWGILFVYGFFQIPLMVIIFTPAMENMKKEWAEANDSLGGSHFQYLRYVAIPTLIPAFLSATLLLFASSFSAYATARAMTIGNLPLVPLVIGTLVDGNVIPSEANLGDALAMGMVAVSVVVIAAYLALLRFSKRRS